MVNLQIADSYQKDGLEEILGKASYAALLILPPAQQEYELSIVITGDDEVQSLNQQYLGVDAPTDVLSFPANEVDPDTKNLYLGDIIISYPRAQAQAHARGGSDFSELQLLVVHGVLHLFGYDHADEDQKAQMWSFQIQVLKDLGLESINPS